MNILASRARNWLSNSDHDNSEGQALVEYSLIIALIIIACLVAVTNMGDVVTDVLWGQVGGLPF